MHYGTDYVNDIEPRHSQRYVALQRLAFAYLLPLRMNTTGIICQPGAWFKIKLLHIGWLEARLPDCLNRAVEYIVFLLLYLSLAAARTATSGALLQCGSIFLAESIPAAVTVATSHSSFCKQFRAKVTIVDEQTQVLQYRFLLLLLPAWIVQGAPIVCNQQ